MRAYMKVCMVSYVVKVFSCFLVVLGVFGLVWLRSSIRSVEYEIGALERELGGVQKGRKVLVAERASLFSIQKTGKIAGERIGLDFPDRAKVFYVKRDKGDIPYEASFRK